MDLLKLTALELGEKIKAKEVTVREAVDAVIGQIRESESEIHSFVLSSPQELQRPLINLPPQR